VKAPAPATGRKASPKVLLAAAASLVVLAGVAIGLSVASSGGSSTRPEVGPRGSLVNALPGARDVRELFRGITQRENVLGVPDAPVTLVEYADLQCPYCRDFGSRLLPGLIDRYVRAGKVKLELRPLAFLGPDSVRGRDALIAAGRQNRLFDFMALLYLNQGVENTGWLSEGLVQKAAASIPGVDVARLLATRTTPAVASRGLAFDSEARATGITSTPTLLVGRSGGPLRRVEATQLAAAIDAAS
jgi:protein-disulfide isomerase